MRKPSPLYPGDTIGIVAPSSPVPPEELQKGIAVLEERGYRVFVGESVLATVPGSDYLAGSDAARVADIEAIFAREDIAAVICARGGYGAMRLLPLLDWEKIARHPRLFLGYSDITSLHAALARKAGLVTLYGPNLTTLPGLDETASRLLWRMLEDPIALGTLPTPGATLQTVVPGIVEGELAGGCLSLLAHACGSDFAPDFEDKIVLIEDVNENIYRADRDLTQLRNAGLLDSAAGFVVGTITHWQKKEADPPRNRPETLWQEIFGPLGKPTLAGFPFGHEPHPLTLPLGVHARLDAGAQTLTLLEPATLRDRPARKSPASR